jgi:transcription elongation GreA/GreB family factor
MNKLELKRDIIVAGKQKLETVINDFKERIAELKADALDETQEESASQSESRQDGELELMDSLIAQLDFAEREMEVLNQIKVDAEHKEVDFGSVVITDKRNLFISTGIEDFKANETAYFGLSTQAPLYKNMAGLKAGDSLSFNGINYSIKEVY